MRTWPKSHLVLRLLALPPTALAAMLSSSSLAVPPPPPPAESRASYQAIDRLALLEGEWEQSRTIADTVHPAGRRVGRFGEGQDHLLIGSLILIPKAKSPGAFDDRCCGPLEIVSFDVLRGGYRIYNPGFFGNRATTTRGSDEPIEVSFPGTREVILRNPTGTNAVRTIHVHDDVWEEEITYKLDSYPPHRIVLRRTNRHMVWGRPAE